MIALGSVGAALERVRLVVVVAGAAAVFWALYRLNLAVPLNADQGSSVLEAVAIRRGNLLLKGWVLPPDTFYTTRVLLLAALQALQGAPAAAMVAQSSALLGVALAAAGTWLAGSVAGWWGRAVTFTLLVSAAYLPGRYLLLPGGSDHAGTVVLMLLALISLERIQRSRLAMPAAAALLAVGTVGDPMAAWIGGGAIAATAMLRLAAGRGEWRTELGLLGVSVVGYIAAAGAWHAIHVLGGFDRAGQTLAVVGAGDLPGHIGLAGEGLLTLFGADVLGAPVNATLLPSLVHLIGLAAASFAFVAALRRWRSWELDRTSEILAAGIAIDLVAFVLNSQSGSLVQTRYLLPALAFGAVLLGRQLRAVPGSRQRALIASAIATYAAVFAVQAGTAQAAPPPTASLQHYLAARKLTDGLGDYWQASLITAATHGQIRVRAIVAQKGQVEGYLWLADRRWYTAPGRPARFVVVDTKMPGALDKASLIKALGKPAEEHRVGRYDVLIWRSNLFPKVKVLSR